jgi:biotin transporter BioY
MVTGLIDGIQDVDAAAVGYLVGFLPAAVGFGVLAVSYSRRHRIPRRLAVISGSAGRCCSSSCWSRRPPCWWRRA